MSFRIYLSLFVLGLISTLVIAKFQPFPGYLDSDYYFAGGMQLVAGRGFTEPYLWNYLDGTSSLPHASHTYWMPLASILAALGMWLGGGTSYASARILFILIAAGISPLTAALAYRFSGTRDLAVTSGLLAIFSVYHAPFVGVTDNFGPFIMLGGVYFLNVTAILSNPEKKSNWFMSGVIAGLLSLSRSDGLLWFALGFLFLWRRKDGPGASRRLTSFAWRSSLMFLGYLLVMAPWYARNMTEFGALMPPGGERTLWLGHYDQTFIYPPDLLSPDSFLALGWKEIVSDRLRALGTNLQSGFAAHGGIILFPFILAGVIEYRRDDRVWLASLAWLILLFVMTVFFPFAGARGAFFHAGAALQPMWWTLAPLGLESLLASLRKKGWGNDQTRIVFRSALVMIAMILTIFVVYLRLFSLGWGEGEENYPAVERFLLVHGIEQNDIVIVRNAPGYYIGTGRSAISIPYGGEAAILAVAGQFDAHYLVLEPQAAIEPIEDLFKSPERSLDFSYLGEVNGTRIYKINHE